MSQDRVSVSLTVSIAPAQGNAQVEIVPDEQNALGPTRVFVDWRRMQDTEATPEEWLEGIERICPPVVRRVHSHYCWRQVLPYVREETKSGYWEEWRLDRIHGLLRRRDTDRPYGYAVSSDGTVSVDQELLDSYTSRLTEALISSTEEDWVEKYAFRILAWTFAANRRLERYLLRLAQTDGEELIGRGHLAPSVLPAIGCCIRDPKTVAEFTRALNRRLAHSHSGCMHWLKGMSLVLKYREHATRDMTTGLCEKLLDHLLAILSDMLQEVVRSRSRSTQLSKFRPYIFRYASLCVVYVLRKRAYDDAFLPPTSPRATEAKRIFREALDLARKGRIYFLGGEVDQVAELRKFIKYIDREGHGPLASAELDD